MKLTDDLTLEICVKIQQDYARLGKDIPFTKKNLCDLLNPYQVKHGLTDREVLSVARNELSLPEVNDLIKKYSAPHITSVAILVENGGVADVRADGPVKVDIYDTDINWDCKDGVWKASSMRCEYDTIRANPEFHSVLVE